MHLDYLNKDGKKIGSTEVKFMPHVGESVDLGNTGKYKITNIVRNNPQQIASVYLEEEA